MVQTFQNNYLLLYFSLDLGRAHAICSGGLLKHSNLRADCCKSSVPQWRSGTGLQCLSALSQHRMNYGKFNHREANLVMFNFNIKNITEVPLCLTSTDLKGNSRNITGPVDGNWIEKPTLQQFFTWFVPCLLKNQVLKGAKTTMSTAILCPVVCISNIMNKANTCDKSIKMSQYVTIQPFSSLHWYKVIQHGCALSNSNSN